MQAPVRFMIICLFMMVLFSCSRKEEHVCFTNSVGMKMMKIESGDFRMGDLTGDGQWDESPVHRVTISRPFYISETEITIEQFQQFSSAYRGVGKYAPYATGINWYEAEAFCRWLSDREGKSYRLPTEAEWEYVCRAGTTSAYHSGGNPPDPDTPNAWGVKNMHTGVLEWCLDWYGPYLAGDRVDPVGADGGFARVIRGGLPDDKQLNFNHPFVYYSRSANRSGVAPAFDGFRAVEADLESYAPDENYEQFQDGLTGILFDNVMMSKPLSQWRILRLDSDEVPWQSLNDWSVAWRGSLKAPHTGEVTFQAEVDDGMRLIIDQQSVIDAWEKGKTAIGKFRMTEGQKYPVLLSYFNDGGESFLRLYWSWEGQERQPVPDQALSFTAYDDYMVKKQFTETFTATVNEPVIGFRVLQGPMPATGAWKAEQPFVMQGVRQSDQWAKNGPDMEKPYFRKRYLLPIPPENVPQTESVAAGIHPMFSRHNHDPGFTVCPNGDLLVVLFSSTYEDEPEVCLMSTRLRFGEEQWDMPSAFLDFPDVNDVAPLLWNDAGTIWFFFGNIHLGGMYPFQWTTSTDNGANWTEVRYPQFNGSVGPRTPQPINSAFRDTEGTIYVPSDGLGASSLLYASKDDARTWMDTGGRTGGRHTTFVLLKNVDILGMGGKHSNIDGFMTKSISHDHGRTWEISKTPFPCLGTNQRATILRLASGNLFYAADYQRTDGFQPPGIDQRGSFVALSEDEGQTWHVKKLSGGQEHESEQRRKEMRGETLGYAVACQAPDGLIHLIATMTHPCLHFAFNESWILSDEKTAEDSLMRSSATCIQNVTTYEETYPNGMVRLRYSGGIADDARFLLHGTETWFYEDGSKQYEANFRLGEKIGFETYWDAAGGKSWQWNHQADGISVWTQWWENGRKKAESSWRQGRCNGMAMRWDDHGECISQVQFIDGEVRKE